MRRRRKTRQRDSPNAAASSTARPPDRHPRGSLRPLHQTPTGETYDQVSLANAVGRRKPSGLISSQPCVTRQPDKLSESRMYQGAISTAAMAVARTGVARRRRDRGTAGARP